MRYKLLTIFIIIFETVFSQMKTEEPPRLLVGIKIDGLQQEHLNRLMESFSSVGFRKIFSESMSVERMQHDIISAGNASDAATYLTGTYPFYHGISGDNYFRTQDNKIVSILFDENQTGIGTNDKYSAHNLLTTTITDELMLFSPFSKVHVIALDAEDAIMMGGHTATSVSWIDDKKNRWVTTGYYNKGLSRWADAMNVEGDFGKTGKLTTLQADKLVTKLAQTTFEKESLGADQYTDALMLQYSVNSESTNITDRDALYMVMDTELQTLVYYITTRIGLNKTLFYIIGGTNDMHTPKELGNNHIPSGYFNADRALALINSYLIALYGQEKWIKGYYGKNIYLDKKKIEDKKLNINEIKNKICDFLKEFEGVQAAYPVNDIINFNGNSTDIRTKFRNSYNKNTAGDIVIALLPGWVELDDNGKIVGGTNSPQVFVPFYIYGEKIKAKKIAGASTLDIAPTISKILKIPEPNACLGKSLID